MVLQDICEWVIQTDRRMLVIRAFNKEPFVNAAILAERTGRSVQNISIALNELENEGLIDQIGDTKRSWKKYKLSKIGQKVLAEIDRQSNLNKSTIHIWQKEIRFVRDAYQLIVPNPCSVLIGASLIEALERNLEDARTKNVYIVDRKRKLHGVIPLQFFLETIQKHSLPKLMISEIIEDTDIDLQKKVEEVMIKSNAIHPDEKLTVALKRMIKHNLEDIPVVDSHGKLIGELNGLEILKMFKEDYIDRHGRKIH